jgi:hypothetical protein
MSNYKATAAFFIAILFNSSAFSQSFSCQVRSGGIDIFGSNNHNRVLRCQVTCDYWKSDGSKGYQRCETQLQPNTSDKKLCSFNSNDASQVIGTSHDCR